MFTCTIKILKSVKYITFAGLLLIISMKKSTAMISYKMDYNKGINEAYINILSPLSSESLINLILPKEYYANQSDVFMKYLFTMYQLIVTQMNSTVQPKDILVGKPDVYVFFINKYPSQAFNQLQNMVNQLQLSSRSWNPEAKFLLITSTTTDSQAKRSVLAIKAINFLWQRNVFKVVILMVYEDFNDDYVVFSSAPYSKRYNTCKEITNKKQLLETNKSDYEVRNILFGGFTFEIPKTFSGCPLIAYTTDPMPPYTVAEKNSNLTYKSGIEIDLINLLAQAYDFSLRLSTPNMVDNNAHLYFLTNGTPTGLLEDLITFKKELVFGGLKPPANNHLKIDITLTYGFTSIAWFVPDGETGLYWNTVFNFLSVTTWLILLAISVLFFIVCYIMSPKSDRNGHIFYYLMGVLVGISYHRPPRSGHLRIMLVSWYLFSMHVNIMYNTNLYSLLTHPPTDPGIRTIKEFYDRKFKICLPQSWKQKHVSDPIVSAIFKNALTCDDLETAVEKLINDRDFGILAKADHINSLVDIKRDRIHRLNDTTYSYPIGITLSKGSILRSLLNRVILVATESGLIQKWLNNIQSKIQVKPLSIRTSCYQRNSFGIGKEELMWLYISLLYGYLIACIILLIEVLYGKYIKLN